MGVLRHFGTAKMPQPEVAIESKNSNAPPGPGNPRHPARIERTMTKNLREPANPFTGNIILMLII